MSRASTAQPRPTQSGSYDVIVIGAGAAGLMAAISAGRRGRRVLVLDHANKVGKKILMSGGGRCNFTNLHTTPDNFISANPHFCKSALARYSPWQFLTMVEEHGIPWHEKGEAGSGQLFCDRSSKDIVAMLLAECTKARVEVRTQVSIQAVSRGESFTLTTSAGSVQADRLVVATGGLSIPKMGATGFGYTLAEQFGLPVLPTRAGLVPFTLHPDALEGWAQLSGVSAPVHARCESRTWSESLLITHRGLSGPAMLQLSSYWQPGESLRVDWLSGEAPQQWIKQQRAQSPRRTLPAVLSEKLGRRLGEQLFSTGLSTTIAPDTPIGALTRAQMQHLSECLADYVFKPSGTEGYRTAEVTLGGVDTDAISSTTFEAKSVPGLFFVGEVLDVTGHLGGYNFQWAWASGWAAGQAV